MNRDRIYREYTPRLLNYLKTFDYDESEDLCQDVLLKAFLALPALRDENKMGPWLFSIARNQGLKHLKEKKTRIESHSDIDPEEIESAELSMEAEKEWLYINTRKLSGLDKDIATLRIYGNLKLDEIAEILNMRPSSVRSRMSRIPEKLRKFKFDPQISKTMESIMNKIEHIKQAASVFERMSLEDQTRLISTAAESKNLPEKLVIAIGKTQGGKEFLGVYGKTMTLKEAIWILNYIDGYTEERVIRELIDSNPEAADMIMRNMFVLEDIVLFNKAAVERVWGKVDEQILMAAMIDVPASVRNHMLSPFKESIRNEKLLSILKIEADRQALKSARHFVVEEIRSLVENGEISIQRAV